MKKYYIITLKYDDFFPSIKVMYKNDEFLKFIEIIFFSINAKFHEGNF